MVIKALLVLIIELTVCYLLGLFINKCMIKRKTNVIDSTLAGFFLYQIICQMMTLVCYYTTGVVHYLSIAWAVLVVFLSVMSVIFCKKAVLEDIRCIRRVCMREKLAVSLLILLVAVFGYYAAINGETNADSQYYIGLVNTTASTDTLYKYNPYNGFESDAFFLRRALTSFEIHSAVLCRLFDIHALVLTRITRAVQNVILTSGAVYLWGMSLYKREKAGKHKKACVLVGVYLVLQMVFACNYYTSANFFLTRAYEGKAFTANVVLLYVIFVSRQFAREKNIKNLAVILLVLWGSAALSSSALFLVPIASAVVIIPCVFVDFLDCRNRNYKIIKHYGLENKGRKRCRK